MASKLSALIFLNLLFFICVSSTPCAPPKPVTPSPCTPKCGNPVTPAPVKPTKCPKDTLKLGVCADLLGGLVNLVVGSSSRKCCSLLSGIADLNAGVCLCTAIKANLLGIIKLDVPVAVNLLVNACGLDSKKFKC
ncbi:hypothetical protein ACHQM5_001352 [Ranunculus cassubicifolius]